jgi:hypothetical protein
MPINRTDKLRFDRLLNHVRRVVAGADIVRSEVATEDRHEGGQALDGAAERAKAAAADGPPRPVAMSGDGAALEIK